MDKDHGLKYIYACIYRHTEASMHEWRLHINKKILGTPW